MKILIYNPFTLWSYHFATDLEIALQHIKKSDDVNFLVCESSLSICELNENGDFETCFVCSVARNSGLRLIDLPAGNIHKLRLDKQKKEITFPEFDSLDSLKNFKFDNINFGLFSASSLISKIREPRPDFKKYKVLTEKYLRMSINLYYGVYQHLEKIRPDIFYIFNGRLAVVRPAFHAARNLGIKTYVHERSGNLKFYTLAENALPHELEYIKPEIESHWYLENNAELKKNIAEKWYQERRNGMEQSWYSFVKDQKNKKLPETFSENKRNIAIFNSSDDEMECIDEIWKNTFYKSQEEAISKILTNINSNEFHFYLRMHPFLEGIDNSQTEAINKLNFANLTIIKPDEVIDSYALLDACEKVITFGSTLGVESNFWGKPSILLGHSFYENLGTCYIAHTYEDAYRLIKDELKPLDKTGALKYGYWQQSYGIEYKFYNPVNFNYGEFLGKDLTTHKHLKDQNELFEIVEDYLKTNIFIDFSQSEELISIIVNNSGVTTKRLTESILEQNYQHWELIFTGIKPNNLFENNHPLITYESGNIGKAVGVAKGKYILFLDSDKILFSTALNYFINNLSLFDNKTRLICGDYIKWNTEKGILEFVPEILSLSNKNNIFSGLLLFEKEFLKEELANLPEIENLLESILTNYKTSKIELPLACQLDNITKLSSLFDNFNQAVKNKDISRIKNIFAEINYASEPDPLVYYQYGRILKEKNEFLPAIKELSQAIKLGLKTKDVFADLAYCVEKIGDTKTSEQLMRRSENYL